MTSADEQVILVSKENEKFSVPVTAAKLSKIVESTIDTNDDDEHEDGKTLMEIPMKKVSGAILYKVIEYCTHHQAEPMTEITTPLKSSRIEDMVQPWYAGFIRVEHGILFELVAAANYMDIKPLLDLACLGVAVMIKGKSAEDLRNILNISEYVTPEQQAEIRQENEMDQPQPQNQED
eukprot:CAMPEP_0194048862 /NCGR_PEP_ID=MMETSP0009_2-20130614/28791_1 /TAXON_ID=210454 /ORGANISM="Grammatophora oceanica, Strain CCMP 410" /LENGTH=177 /DNA_ID=CAMNT_0038694869 /DNA_START=66 /DNA_END=599 /DNA_ORIENTATION=+